MRNRDFMSCFVKGEKAVNGNLRSEGDTLFSYFTAIGQKINGKYVVNSTKYSVSTSAHQTYLRRELQKRNINFTETTKYVPRETKDLTAYI